MWAHTTALPDAAASLRPDRCDNLAIHPLLLLPLLLVLQLAAIRSMDPATIPVLVTLAGLLLSAAWLAYGLMTSNWFVAGPNVAGVVLSSVQLLVAAYVVMRVRADPSLTKRPAGSSGEVGTAAGDDSSHLLSQEAGGATAPSTGYRPLQQLE